jgi:hypothetical protein
MRRWGRLAVISAMVVALAGFMTLSAHAALIGPSVTFDFTNFPGGATTTTATLGSGLLVTSGDVQVFITQVATPGGGEWDNFYFSTISGGPLAAISTANWQILSHITLTQAVNFNGIEDQWTTGGFSGTPVPLASLTPSGFINVAGTGPIGDGYVNGYGTTGSAFSDLIAAGLQDFPTFVDPYSFANTGGGIPLNADGFNIALHFDPVPLPGTLPLVLSGLGALVAWRRWTA